VLLQHGELHLELIQLYSYYKFLTKRMNLQRHNWINGLKSLAITLMVFANSAAYFFNSEVNVYFRIGSSLAAPLFIFLAGANLILSNEAHLKKFIIRGAYLFVTAACIDFLIWRIVPFATFDVLYLISFGIIICGIFRFGHLSDFAFGTTFILASFLVQANYRFEIEELRLAENDIFSSIALKSNLMRALIDGWFPILPWIGFMFLGRWAMSIVYTIDKNVILFSFLFFVSTFFGITYSSLNSIRNNYIEIFYPVNGLFLLLSLAFLFFAFSGTANLSERICVKYESKYSFGRKSLSIYIIHCIIIASFADTFPIKQELGLLLFCIIQFVVFYIYVWFVELFFVKRIILNIPSPIRRIIGL
jgi:hypothetical protein